MFTAHDVEGKKKTKRKFRINTLRKHQPVNYVFIVTNWELGVFLCVLSNDKWKGKQKNISINK